MRRLELRCPPSRSLWLLLLLLLLLKLLRETRRALPSTAGRFVSWYAGAQRLWTFRHAGLGIHA